MKIYGIPGLGGDKRLYGEVLAYLPELEPLNFLQPLEKQESLPSYARRMAEHYQIPEGAILVGISFGGAVAQEMARSLGKGYKVILVSSMVDAREIRQPLRFYGNIGAYWLINRLILGIPWFYLSLWLDKLTLREADLLNRMARNGTVRFLRWGAWQASNFHNRDFSFVLARIHGTRDKMFPRPLFLEPDWVAGASHFAVLTHPKEVARRVLKCIEEKVEE